MAVSLTKIVDDNTTNKMSSDERVVTCLLCEQTYLLRYSETEGHHLSAWLKKADIAVRKGHIHDSHNTEALKLDW